jgi:glycosyltransferase involved in cell wall biosynthesis
VRVIINLPDLRAYCDTLMMIGEISKSVSRVDVLTNDDQSISPELLRRWPRLNVHPLPRARYPAHASRWISIRADLNEVDVIHDMFGHFATFCEAPHPPRRPYVMITTQRTTNWGWFERVRPLGYTLNRRYAGQRALSLWNDTRILNAVDHIVVLGPGHEEDVIHGHGIRQRDISYIPSETDTDLFCLPSDDEERLRERQVILYTGALSRNKGLDLSLSLFSQLGERFPQLQLQLIGRVPPFERRWVEKSLNQHPLRSRIEVIEGLPRVELISRYKRSGVYLFPSLFEGSPRALREAIACGCVAVASDIPGCRGIDPNGRFIHFAPPRKLELWEKVVSDALIEPADDYLGRQRRGYTRLRTAHSPERVAQNYVDLYRTLLKERATARL